MQSRPVARTAADLDAVKASIASKAEVSVETVANDLALSLNVDHLVERFADVDILINNAGAIPGGPLLQVDEATWRRAGDLKVRLYQYVPVLYAAMKARGSASSSTSSATPRRPTIRNISAG